MLAPNISPDELKRVCLMKNEDFDKWAEKRGGLVVRNSKSLPETRGGDIRSSMLDYIMNRGLI